MQYIFIRLKMQSFQVLLLMNIPLKTMEYHS